MIASWVVGADRRHRWSASAIEDLRRCLFTRNEPTAPEDVDPGPLAQAMEDLVDAMARRDRDDAIAALQRTVPTDILSDASS